MFKRTTHDRSRPVKLIIAACILFLPICAAAQTDDIKVPDEVRPFIEKGMIPIALETGDLNADGLKDYVLVISEVVAEDAQYEEGAGARSVLVLIRETSGKLVQAARNLSVAYCKVCGGVFGDPFAGVSVRGTRFTVSNYGGSNDRWAYDYTFAYSIRDRTWQLVRAEETSFHALDPKRTMRKHIYTPPKDFGLINFADFDPDIFLGKGKK
jgi:hypothetical protein